jgi:hypothetical protein
MLATSSSSGGAGPVDRFASAMSIWAITNEHNAAESTDLMASE